MEEPVDTAVEAVSDTLKAYIKKRILSACTTNF